MAFDPDDYRSLLCIAPDHLLQLADSKVHDQGREQRESHLLKELDSAENLIAHYRVWIRQSSQAPYRSQRGWEKFSPDGSLLDREVRYTQQPAGIILH